MRKKWYFERVTFATTGEMIIWSAMALYTAYKAKVLLNQ